MKRVILPKEKIHVGMLQLVNALYPLECENEEEFVPANPNYPNILINCKVASALQLVLKTISSGNEIIPVSGYRSFEEQTKIYDDSLKENGEIFTKKFVALPGRSEHQTGLAIDLALNKEEIDFICPDFPYEGICEVFRQTAYDYGFIERYPKGKENITGISHEPWHFRYVGYPHSRIIQQKGVTLEEYIDLIKSFNNDHKMNFTEDRDREFSIYYVPACGDKTEIQIQEDCFYEISGNNVDGFIVTVWRKKDDEK